MDPGEADLLPAPHELMRCAPHARAHNYDSGGTAISAAVLMVVEVPLPWPKPVFTHPALTTITSTMPTALGDGRVLAAVPSSPDRLVVRRFDRTRGGALLSTTTVADPADLAATIHASLACTTLPDDAAPLDAPVALVCTQGTHDVCCGIDGTRLAMELADERDGTEVIRVSHTGGHRFAPTAMTLPDGRMWAGLDLTTYRTIRDRSRPAAPVAARCRGWWGAPPGAAQVAERCVFAEVGWDWDDMVRDVTVVEEDGPTVTWEVVGDGRTWRVRTEPHRTVPVLSCRAPGGLPAKTATEYTATIVARP